MRIHKEVLVVIWGSLMGGFIVAHLVTGKLSVRSLEWMLPVSGVIFILWRLLVWGLCSISHHAVRDSARRLGDILNLKIDDAKCRAEDALKDARVFACIDADREPPEVVSELGGCISETFSRYKQITVLGEETVLGWDQIGTSAYGHGLIRIGTDMDLIEYVVRPGADGVFELDSPLEDTSGREDPLYPSIYHLMVTVYESKS